MRQATRSDEGASPVVYPRLSVLAPDSTRTLRRIVLIVAGVIVVAMVKPWGGQKEEAVGRPYVPPLAAMATAQPRASDDPLEAICHESPSWRVASVGLFVDRAMREWGFITPVVAEGPTDPAIPFVVFAYTSVEALGYCAPVRQQPPADLEVRVYRLDGGVSGTRVSVLREARTPSTSVAGLFSVADPPMGPSASAGVVGPDPSWPPGRYAFVLHGHQLGDLWFGAEVRATLAGT